METGADIAAKKGLAEGSDDDNVGMVEDDKRGRKRQRSQSDDDDYMEVEGDGKSTNKTSAKTRSMTPKQLKIRSQSKLRTMSQGRREGSEPPVLPYKIQTEESIRLAKKINKKFKHKIFINEADRKIGTKMPKHLFSGKRGNGKNERR